MNIQDNDKNNIREKSFFSLLNSYCERNRQDHLRHKGGWTFYIQNMYLGLQKGRIDSA